VFHHLTADLTWQMTLERQSHYRAGAARARAVRAARKNAVDERHLQSVPAPQPSPGLFLVARPVPTSSHPSARSRPHPDDRHAA
jgi:hypothetical protein